jgi:hypothetical protein
LIVLLSVLLFLIYRCIARQPGQTMIGQVVRLRPTHSQSKCQGLEKTAISYWFVASKLFKACSQFQGGLFTNYSLFERQEATVKGSVATKQGFLTTKQGIFWTRKGFLVAKKPCLMTKLGFLTTEQGIYATKKGFVFTKQGFLMTKKPCSMTGKGFLIAAKGI